MSTAALVLYLVALVVVFGVRTAVQIRRTGSSGFHGISGTPGSLRWWAGVLFVLALVVSAASLVLAVAGVVAPPAGDDVSAMAVVGLLLVIAGFIGVVLAQSGMGTSWRIGVDESERTDLVTGGLFALVRNPIFTAMVATQAGLTLMVPTWLSVVALVCLTVAVELQVRLIEEPYLLAAHPRRYRTYASTTGRFVPGVGRLPAPAEARIR
ncbi:Protein-S-isoprenylcysteine O-methyltransferase Ste14 [Blastococcus aurantiacus]|uniref:Protein-S-isoprenylcysteine O-methyltransferase Ste14 n=1 Tax=Blastococcus aurantiacus TaxID=1550231 RepID=A0A1G7R9D5_9ACTN|nr:isoprenylcysteine carboxylmethyltransferase family protein [Blastococcus aurantiacus]SDG07255.1 Protein-S-isoprenylcysteine O-methyltransferase Ste14 [Blastococcus aurantiacus]